VVGDRPAPEIQTQIDRLVGLGLLVGVGSDRFDPPSPPGSRNG
jgi:hypothetical protein